MSETIKNGKDETAVQVCDDCGKDGALPWSELDATLCPPCGIRRKGYLTRNIGEAA